MSDMVKGATKTVLMLTVFSFISKILGFVRVTLIASRYGSGSNTDAFFLALSTITMFSAVVTSTIGTTLIPVLGEVEAKEGKKGKQEHLNNFVSIIAVVSMILVVLAFIFAPLLLRILASGFEDEQFQLVVTLTRIGVPTIFFSALIGVFRGYLQSEGFFKETAVATLFTNIVMIAFLLTLSTRFDVRGLMVAYVIGQAAPLILQLATLKKNDYKYNYLFDLQDIYMKRVLKMIPPVLVGVAITDINNLVSNSLASGLAPGSISALDYARRLDSVTIGVFVNSIMTVLFPMLSSAANSESRDGLKKATIRGVNTIILIAVPAAVGMMVLAEPIVVLAFQRGKFDEVATAMTTNALFFFSIGVIATSLRTFLFRVFYSVQDTKTPVVNSGITVLFIIAFSLVLIGPMEHAGLALATSLAQIVGMFLLIRTLVKNVGSFGFSSSLKVGIKSFVSAAAMGLVARVTFNLLQSALGVGTINLAISLLVAVGLAAVVYFLLIYLLKVDELSMLIDSFMKKIKKN